MTIKKIFCKHLVYTLPFPVKDDTNVYFYHCLKCDKYFTEPPLLTAKQWIS